MLIVCDAAKYDACCNAQGAFYMQTDNHVGFFVAPAKDPSLSAAGRALAFPIEAELVLSPASMAPFADRGEGNGPSGDLLGFYSESTTPTTWEKPQST